MRANISTGPLINFLPFHFDNIAQSLQTPATTVINGGNECVVFLLGLTNIPKSSIDDYQSHPMKS
jgi:hypothetical protein